MIGRADQKVNQRTRQRVRNFVVSLMLAVATVTLGGCSDGEPGAPGESGEASESAAKSGTARTSEPVAKPVAKPVAEVGEETYNRYCFSCHASGVAGAPRLGDQEAWVPRIAKGKAMLLASTIEGIAPGMPARGLCSSCSDDALAAAVDYMVERSQ